MYAIMNKRTRKWVYGTHHQDGRRVQRTSEDRALLYDNFNYAKADFLSRGCGKDYQIVPVRLERLEG